MSEFSEKDLEFLKSMTTENEEVTIDTLKELSDGRGDDEDE